MLVLFHNNTRLAPELLHHLKLEMPGYTEVRTDSANLTDLNPAEYRADLVLLLMRDSQPVMGIVVEVQLSKDPDKLYAWPAYVANLRARIRCPVCLLVVTTDENVARWADRPIELGGESRIVPWVIGPREMPAITDQHQAEDNVELAVLSARAHGSDPDIQLAARVAAAAIMASAGIDAERSYLYLNFILQSLSEDARREMTSMKPAMREYVSDFAREYLVQGMAEGKAQGRVEGEVEGRAEIVLALLAWRFGPLAGPVQERVREACSRRLESPQRLLAANSLEEALSLL
ncbi:MAG TPA: hypothetical protein VF221_21955 [Chloroflexota bacterium]